MSLNTSNYITDRTPNQFGGQQVDYVLRRDKTVEEGANKTRTVLNSGGDLEAFFIKTLCPFLARERQDTAVAHHTENAERFGCRRLEETSEDVFFTALSGAHYEEYNKKITAVFQGILKGNIPLEGSPIQKKFSFEETALNRRCKFELELFTIADIQANKWDQDPGEELKKWWASSPGAKQLETDLKKQEKERKGAGANGELLEHEIMKKRLALTKKERPDLYKSSIMYSLLGGIERAFPTYEESLDSKENPDNLKSLYLLGKVRIHINNNLYALCEYLTWTHQDGTTDPVKRLSRSTVVVLSQDQFLVNDTLKDAASVFARTLKLNPKENDQDIKNNVALIRYLIATSMPWVQGSAAIGENVELITYKVLGIPCKHNPKKSGDLEAIAAPLWSTFFKNYPSTVIFT